MAYDPEWFDEWNVENVTRLYSFNDRELIELIRDIPGLESSIQHGPILDERQVRFREARMRNARATGESRLAVGWDDHMWEVTANGGAPGLGPPIYRKIGMTIAAPVATVGNSSSAVPDVPEAPAGTQWVEAEGYRKAVEGEGL